jgi:hypothetical protein
MSVAYLSAEWIEAADALLRATPIVPPIDGPGFTIETLVIGSPTGDRGYVIEFAASEMRARPSVSGEEATVRLTQRYDIAAAVAQGTMSAQAAFLAADIQVGGDVATLIGHANLVAQVGDALAPLRDRTSFVGAD